MFVLFPSCCVLILFFPYKTVSTIFGHKILYIFYQKSPTIKLRFYVMPINSEFPVFLNDYCVVKLKSLLSDIFVSIPITHPIIPVKVNPTLWFRTNIKRMAANIKYLAVWFNVNHSKWILKLVWILRTIVLESAKNMVNWHCLVHTSTIIQGAG